MRGVLTLQLIWECTLNPLEASGSVSHSNMLVP